MDEKVVPGTILAPEQAMRLAIAEARKGAAFVSPNPLVGCVILNAEGKLLATGHHAKYGGPHAEADAVSKLSSAELKNAQVYVTLEPCAHEGKTPSCAKMLAKLPLKKVIYGLKDPNPLVSGQGAQIIKDAGIACELYNGLTHELEDVCEAFLWNFRHKNIFVALKLASSLDGRIALEDGTSQWITGTESREKAHELRAAMDAVAIGAGTLQKDNPSLNVRLPHIKKSNKVVVFDTEARHLRDSWKIFGAHAPENIFWMIADDVKPGDFPFHVLRIPRAKNGGLNLPEAMKALWDAGLRSLLVEGGGKLAGAFLREGLVNRLHLFQAPILLGDKGIPWNQGFTISKMADRPMLKHVQHSDLGRDLHLTGLLREPYTGDQCRDV